MRLALYCMLMRGSLNDDVTPPLPAATGKLNKVEAVMVGSNLNEGQCESRDALFVPRTCSRALLGWGAVA